MFWKRQQLINWYCWKELFTWSSENMRCFHWSFWDCSPLWKWWLVTYMIYKLQQYFEVLRGRHTDTDQIMSERVRTKNHFLGRECLPIPNEKSNQFQNKFLWISAGKNGHDFNSPLFITSISKIYPSKNWHVPWKGTILKGNVSFQPSTLIGGGILDELPDAGKKKTTKKAWKFPMNFHWISLQLQQVNTPRWNSFLYPK